MGGRNEPVRLSFGELEIMRMLWERGPLSISQAHDCFANYGRPVSYPTMQTRLNRLAEKGYVRRNPERPATYAAAITRDQAGAGHLSQLIARIGGRSVVPLVAHLLAERPLSRDEIKELRRLLSEAEKPHPSRKKGTH